MAARTRCLRISFAQIGEEFFGCCLSPESLYDKMTILAGSLGEDDECPRVEPYFNGTRLDPARAAQITSIRAANFTPAHLSLGMIRGMLDELMSYYDISRPRHIPSLHVVGSGNGFRRNSVLRKELALRFGCPVVLPPNQEEAAIGAALTAGVGIGLFAGWKDAGRALYAQSTDHL